MTDKKDKNILTAVSSVLKQKAKNKAKEGGISLSEYIRNLIIKDVNI